MERGLQPIYCLADSQLLFWREEGASEPWLASVRERLRSVPAGAEERAGDGDAGIRAAYVGASSGDEPAFYSIFQGAVEGIGIEDHRMILSRFDEEDRTFLASADLIVLSGGDPVRGWKIFEQSGLQEAITRRYFEGAILLGVSAGAVQLGWAAAPDEGTASNGAEAAPAPEAVTLTFRLVPAVVGVHEEDRDWARLRRLMEVADVSVRGLGIPAGGGVLYHPDGVIEPVRLPVHELVPDHRALRGGDQDRLRHSLLLPGEAEPIDDLETASADPVH